MVGGKWTGCHIQEASLSSGRRSEALTECRSKYVDPQLEVYLGLWVSEAVEQSAPTARLPIPHPLPQPLILNLGLKFKSCL